MMKVQAAKDHDAYFSGSSSVDGNRGKFTSTLTTSLKSRKNHSKEQINSQVFTQILMRHYIHDFNLLTEYRGAGFMSCMRGCS